jgi:hypothetical protein
MIVLLPVARGEGAMFPFASSVAHLRDTGKAELRAPREIFVPIALNDAGGPAGPLRAIMEMKLGPTRFELVTSSLSGTRSNQLSYEPALQG